jgi:hypothetical protein
VNESDSPSQGIAVSDVERQEPPEGDLRLLAAYQCARSDNSLVDESVQLRGSYPQLSVGSVQKPSVARSYSARRPQACLAGHAGGLTDEGEHYRLDACVVRHG